MCVYMCMFVYTHVCMYTSDVAVRRPPVTKEREKARKTVCVCVCVFAHVYVQF